MPAESQKPDIKAKPPKKKYTPPVLTDYGTIKDITKSVGIRQASDSGSTTGMTKTAV